MRSEPAWIWEWPALELSLNVSQNVACTFFQQCQFLGENERGGQLFVDLSHENGLWLTEATLPHIKDKAGPAWLELNQDRCKEEIQQANKSSLQLIGYWHTHPEAIPKISSQDIQSFRIFSSRNSRFLSTPLAIIVGNGSHADSVRAWSFRQDSVDLALKRLIN